MKTLRRLHLYLGCLFAPLLLFFAASGAWQVILAHVPYEKRPPWLLLASTLHTGRGLKSRLSTLSSPAMQWISVAMAVALAVTILLGIVMAFRFGHRLAASLCLFAGLVIPLLLVLWQLYG